MSFADHLQAARLDRHLSLAEAAAVLGVPARTFQGWEQGRLDGKPHFHAPLLEYFARHAPRKKAPKGPPRGRPPRRGK